MTANEVLCRLLRPVSILTNSLPVASPTCDLLLFFAVFAVKPKFVKAMSHFKSDESLSEHIQSLRPVFTVALELSA